ncbi:MAG: hypothetical protein F2536_03995 [Actinobacteria bacterium]|uniref:histidine kinase n=1 Tax=freshwater metagenome TaxID=449393 RepID=A0A6J6CBW0_9ZZZZ|nr:hypothetical protein [Actinomycetota bacterium]
MQIRRLNPFNLLASPYGLSWQNHVVFFALAILALGFFDIDRLGGNFASWFVVFLVGYAVTVGVIELGKNFTKSIESTNQRSVALVLVLLAAGVMRGLAVFEVGFITGLIPEGELAYRLISAPLFVVTAYLLGNALVTSFLSFRAEARRLAAELAKLSQSRASYESDLQLVNQQQRNRVKDLLSAPMWELQKKLETADEPGKLQDALLTMQSINNDVVRPLSHELSATVSETRQGVGLPSNGLGKQIKWPSRVNLSEVQPGWLYLGILLVLGFNSQIAISSLTIGMQIVSLGAVPVIAMFWLEKKIYRKQSLPVVRALIISTVFGLAGSMIGSNLVITAGLARTDLFAFQTISLVLVVKSANLVYGIFMAGWQQSLDELVDVTAQQKIVNSRLRQQLWLGQKALAMELHGSVQATLQALAMKLARMQDVNLAEISQVLAQVRKALSRIENQEYLAGQEFKSLLAELQDLWEGTAEISWNIFDSASTTLENDLGLARCVFEVIRESVTNAVKHGAASQITIDIQLGKSSLSLSISNNGSIFDPQQRALGSELMDQLCLTRELQQQGKLVVLQAELALSPEAFQESLV